MTHSELAALLVGELHNDKATHVTTDGTRYTLEIVPDDLGMSPWDNGYYDGSVEWKRAKSLHSLNIITIT